MCKCKSQWQRKENSLFKIISNSQLSMVIKYASAVSVDV